jgi:hypothetical protein
MTAIFTPQREVLPAAQQKLWPELAPAASLGFVLYGGTAIALRLGHRTSVDFDFFSSQPLDQNALATALPFTRTATALQATPDTLTFLASMPGTAPNDVKVSFFATPGFGRVGQPERTPDGVLLVASPLDLLATKLKTILQRAEAKDYHDIAMLLRAGNDLVAGLGAARTLFGPNFQPGEALKALAYFGDGDLHTLSAADQTLLANASIQVGDVPRVALAAPGVD